MRCDTIPISINTAAAAGMLAALSVFAACGPVYVQNRDDGYYAANPPTYQAPQATYVAPASQQPQGPDPQFGELSAYGSWVFTPEYGRVWVPYANRTAGWRPYFYGHWVFTDYGWTWESDEVWGAGPYHYGRWVWASSHRWVWVPGYTWAPAWVVWRHGGGCVGWAPMPPDAGVSVHFSYWVFVPHQHIHAPKVQYVVVQPTETERVYQQTVVIQHQQQIRGQGGQPVVYHTGPSAEQTQQWTNTPVQPRRVDSVPSAVPRAIPADAQEPVSPRGGGSRAGGEPRMGADGAPGGPAMSGGARGGGADSGAPAATPAPARTGPDAGTPSATPGTARGDGPATRPGGGVPAADPRGATGTTPAPADPYDMAPRRPDTGHFPPGYSPSGRAPESTPPPSREPPPRSAPPQEPPPARQPPAYQPPPSRDPPAYQPPPSREPPPRSAPPQEPPPARQPPAYQPPPSREPPPSRQPPAREPPAYTPPPSRDAPPSRGYEPPAPSRSPNDRPSRGYEPPARGRDAPPSQPPPEAAPPPHRRPPTDTPPEANPSPDRPIPVPRGR
jgi:hypothetical protein